MSFFATPQLQVVHRVTKMQITHSKYWQRTTGSVSYTYASQGLCKQSIKHTHCRQSSICVTLNSKPIGERPLSLSVLLGSPPMLNTFLHIALSLEDFVHVQRKQVQVSDLTGVIAVQALNLEASEDLQCRNLLCEKACCCSKCVTFELIVFKHHFLVLIALQTSIIPLRSVSLAFAA